MISSKAHMVWVGLKANRSNIMRQEYTSVVTKQYKQATKRRNSSSSRSSSSSSSSSSTSTSTSRSSS